MTEFNVGDRVRLTGSEWDREEHGVQAGDIVEISRVYESHKDARFDLPDRDDYWYVYPKDSDAYGSWGGDLATEEEPAKPTVKRSDIAVMEEYEYAHGATFLTGITWLASLGGRLPTGESVSVNRHGATAAEALNNLEIAIREQGWEIE